MTANVQKLKDLGTEGMAKLILDLLHRTIVHHTLWFVEWFCSWRFYLPSRM